MTRRGGLDIELGFDQKITRSNLVAELIEMAVVSQECIVEWKEQARARARQPIDVVAERARLLGGGIVDEELVEQLTRHWVVENARRETMTDEDVEWEVARRAADGHALLHGVPVLINGVRAPRCARWPCMACGASYALLELCTVMAEQRGPMRDIADGLAYLAQGLRQLKPACTRLESALTIEAKEHADLAARLKLVPAPWDDCIAAVRRVEPLGLLLAQASSRARGGARSTELRHARPGTPGRPRNWALIAVSQHLGHGGYSQPRIARIVPDDAAGTDEARLERVRHRLADDDDCRSIVPAPPEE
jgi:hypothetical protein